MRHETNLPQAEFIGKSSVTEVRYTQRQKGIFVILSVSEESPANTEYTGFFGFASE
jgi:hypothetical protein